MSSSNSSDNNDGTDVLAPRVNTSPPVHRLNSATNFNQPSRYDLDPGDDLRESLWMSTYDGDRNLFDALGYVDEPGYKHYRARYERTDIAPAIIDKLPQKAWAKPKIEDTGASDGESEFESAVESFLEGEWTRENPIKVMQRASRMERLGEFSLIFLGLADDNVTGEGASAESLEKEVDDDSLDKLGDEGYAGAEGINYLTPYDQGRIDEDSIDWYNQDPAHPRFGWPKTYDVDLGDDRPDVDIHWERLIHVVADVFDNELRSPSVLKPSLNRIDDIQKILGASAEGYWRSAYQGLVISPPVVNGQQTSFSDDGEGLHNQINRYIQNMSREIFTEANIETIDSSTEDPTGHLDSHIKPLSANHSIPQSILMGNETGERATTEDKAMWHERIAEYRREFCWPKVLRPLIERLIDLNILPEPQGEFRVDWPEISEKSDKDKADVAAKITTAINKGTGGKPLKALTIEELRQEVLGMKAERGSEVEDADMEAVDPGDLDLDEDDERVQEMFAELSGRENANWNPEEHPRGPDGKFVGIGGNLKGVLKNLEREFDEADNPTDSDLFSDDTRQLRNAETGDIVRVESAGIGDEEDSEFGVVREVDSEHSRDYVVETADGEEIDTTEGNMFDGYSVTHVAKHPKTAREEQEERERRRRELREGRDEVIEDADINLPADISKDVENVPDDAPGPLRDTLESGNMGGIGFSGEVISSDEKPEEWGDTQLTFASNLPSETVMMDSEDFANIQQAIGTSTGGSTREEWFRDINPDRVREFESILRGEEEPEGDGIPTPIIELGENGQPTGFQEGRHRALAANAAGIERIPVEVAYNSDTESEFESRTNSTLYETKDPVNTPDGKGVVVDVATDDGMVPEGTPETSSDSPTYVVAVEDGGVGIGFYKASDLEATEIDTDADDPTGELKREASRSNSIDEYIKRAIARFRGNADGRFSWPDPWQEADAPARLIALDAWSSMGGDVSSCINEMKGEMRNPGRFCADFADRLYNYDYWRGDSWAPGE